MIISLCYITINSPEGAKQLGTLAIEQKLAGCSNVFSIQSQFPWNNAMQHEQEYVLLLKTIPGKKNELQDLILKEHPYDIPVFLSWEAEVNEAYGQWITENMNPTD